ncbi:EAL domain-containing protein [Parahaliea mediterranea]|uniref:EAL domain-containing protein n=1 Tax=Parahaliea mediterranea TaxID=651086 RepID=UPI000E2E471B|nr:EAL domain-containing protein [Parahaliea mediterranea]
MVSNPLRYLKLVVPCCRLVAAYCLFAVLLQWLPAGASAHELVHRSFFSVSARGELPGTDVRQFLFDDSGLVWAATEQGLYRISGSVVRRVDRPGAGMDAAGVAHAQGGIDSAFHCLADLGRHGILVCGARGTYLYQPQANRFQPFSPALSLPSPTATGDVIVRALDDSGDAIHLLLDDGTVVSLDRESLRVSLRFRYPPRYPLREARADFHRTRDGGFLVAYHDHVDYLDSAGQVQQRISWDVTKGLVRGLFRDRQQRSWLYASSGLYRFDSDTQRLVQHERFSNDIVSMAQDAYGNFWFAGYTSLFYWNESENLVHDLTADLQEIDNLRLLKKVAAGPGDLVWVSDAHQGVAALKVHALFMPGQHHRDLDLLPLDERMVWSIFVEEDVVWHGGSEHLYRLDLSRDSATRINLDGHEAPGFIYAIAPLPEQRLLIAGFSGVYVLDLPIPSTFASAGAELSVPTTRLLQWQVFSVYQDPANAGVIWLVTIKGLYRLQVSTLQLEHVPVTDARSGGKLDDAAIRFMMRADDGRIWVVGPGVFGYLSGQRLVSLADTIRIDGMMPRFSHLRQVAPDTLWLGTYDVGLLQYQISTGEVQRFSESVGKQCTSVIFLSQTDQYDVAGCLHSLIRRDRSVGHVEIFGPKDGVFDEELNEGAVYYHPEEGLYLGTPDGIVQVDLDEVVATAEADSVMIESVRAVYPDRERLSLSPAPWVYLEPGLTTLIIQLTSQSIVEGLGYRFRYRFLLDGQPQSADLIDLGQQSQIWLTDPPLGQLVLEVQSRGHTDTRWGPLQTFTFQIAPYWWQTRWFQMLALLTVLLSSVAFAISRQQKLVREQAINRALKESEERLDIALLASRSIIWEWWQGDTQAEGRLHLRDPQDAEPGRLANVQVAAPDRERFERDWQKMLTSQSNAIDGEYRMIGAGGKPRWYRLSGRAIEMDRDGQQIKKVAGIVSDVSEQRAIKARHDQLARAIEASADGTLMLNEGERVVSSNSAARSILGYAEGALEALSLAALIGRDASEGGKVLASDDWSGEFRLHRADGSTCPVWLSISKVFDAQENVSLYVMTFSDLSERKAAQEAVMKLSNFDSLTGLPNRRHFIELLEGAIATAGGKQQKLALLALEIDNLNVINEVYSYSTGERILAMLAERLSLVAGEFAVLGLFSETELLLLSRERTEASQVAAFCEALLVEASRPLDILGEKHRITVSIGVSLFPQNGRAARELIQFAQIARTQAAQRPGSSFTFFSPTDAADAAFRLQLENELQDALRKGALQLHFQPQVAVNDEGRCCGVEALLRWQHPEHGWVAPHYIIAAAESRGMSYQLDGWILEQACWVATRLFAAQPQVFRLAVNFSASSFLADNVVEMVAATLAKTGMPAQQLEIEMTESALVKDYSIASKNLNRLRDIGVRVAIDDFGTGYASLEYLRHLDVDVLKIDKCFIDDIIDSAGDRAIVNSLIALGESLGLEIVVEGVEHQEQFDYLASRYGGRIAVQGYFFSRPLPEEGLLAYLLN